MAHANAARPESPAPPSLAPSNGHGPTQNEFEDLLGEEVDPFAARSTDARMTLEVDDLDLLPLRRRLWARIQDVNSPPFLFTSGVRLARVRPVASSTRIIMEEHGVASFQSLLADLAVFEKAGKRGGTHKVAPPYSLVTTMLADAEPPAPPLAGIVSAPLVAPDGTLVISGDITPRLGPSSPRPRT